MTKEALRLSLEALEDAADAIDSWGSYASGYFQVKHDLENDISKARKAITAIKEALAQRSFDYKEHAEGLQRDYDLLLAEYNELKAQRKPLSNEEIGEIAVKSQDGISPHDDTLRFARAIEAALRSNNYV